MGDHAIGTGIHARHRMPFGIGIILRQEIGRGPALRASIRQWRLQHAAIRRLPAHMAENADPHTAAMALQSAHRLVIFAVGHAQVGARQAFFPIAHLHPRQENAERAGLARRIAMAVKWLGAIAEQQPVAAGDNRQLLDRKRRGLAHACAQDLAWKPVWVGIKIDTRLAIGQIGPLQHSLAYFIDHAVAARQGIAHDIEQAAAGPVQKIAAETVAAATMPRIGHLADGKVGVGHVPVRHSKAIAVAVRIAVAHACIEVAGIGGRGIVIAGISGASRGVGKRQIEQQVGRYPCAI